MRVSACHSPPLVAVSSTSGCAWRCCRWVDPPLPPPVAVIVEGEVSYAPDTFVLDRALRLRFPIMPSLGQLMLLSQGKWYATAFALPVVRFPFLSFLPCSVNASILNATQCPLPVAPGVACAETCTPGVLIPAFVRWRT
jgi:hypothetical protein